MLANISFFPSALLLLLEISLLCLFALGTHPQREGPLPSPQSQSQTVSLARSFGLVVLHRGGEIGERRKACLLGLPPRSIGANNFLLRYGTVDDALFFHSREGAEWLDTLREN